VPAFSLNTPRLLLALLAALLISGCTEPVSMSNYEQIESGMTEAQVYDILGEPDTADSIDLGGFSGTLASWESRDAMITIQIFNGEVWGKQYSTKQASN
jgi:hypothetical protein